MSIAYEIPTGPCDICGHEDRNSEEHWELQCVYVPPPIWETKDGRRISLPDIDDEHLTNIFNMIRRKQRFNYVIFDEMVRRRLWEADRGVLARKAWKTLGQPASVNGTVEA